MNVTKEFSEKVRNVITAVAALLLFSVQLSAYAEGPAGYTLCANENGTCSFSGKQGVAYGSNGKFYFREPTSSIGCSNTAFRGDPIPGTVKACYVSPLPPGNGWTQCATENGTCNVSGSQAVAYGGGTGFFEKFVTGSIACNNSTWGDPISGTVKACYTKSGGTGCTAAAINPYLVVSGGSWQNTSNVTITAGQSVTFGPQPTSGTWSWSNGATSREITVTPSSTTSYTATYRDANGCTSSPMVFTVTVGGGTSSGGSGFVFSPYKDISINMNWNTSVISSNVTGSLQPVLNVMPSRMNTLTLAFATGECGSEGWAGMTPSQVATNVQSFVNAGKNYIISTGGANGSFTCGSDAGFMSFIQHYNSSRMVGVDFDIEAGQTAAQLSSLVQRVKNAQASFPNMRFSFTLATLGGNTPQSLGPTGVATMQAIQSNGLGRYLINLMAMDYGSASASNCTLSGSTCQMGQSAVQAARNLHNNYGVPYNQIEVTPMIGGNDTQGETFTLGDVDTLSSFARANGLAGIHFWSFDRDNDCAPGFASPTCNSYGQAGTLGFSNRFISDLGL